MEAAGTGRKGELASGLSPENSGEPLQALTQERASWLSCFGKFTPATLGTMDWNVGL